MPYNISRNIPSILTGQEEQIQDLGYETKIGKQHPWDQIPRVEFNKVLCERILDDLICPLIDRPGSFSLIFHKMEEIKSDYDYNLISQIQRLVVRLDLYSRIPVKNGRAIKPSDYLIYNLRYGPDFTNWLSKVRAAMIKVLVV